MAIKTPWTMLLLAWDCARLEIPGVVAQLKAGVGCAQLLTLLLMSAVQ